ncbi:hypothetical protein RAZWK3B_09696 [Roseobacter sp. AzwK-3b]|nr:hypothetical protein RAZWK3B_09696 [Roseobacter sp. AzwK-3b]
MSQRQNLQIRQKPTTLMQMAKSPMTKWPVFSDATVLSVIRTTDGMIAHLKGFDFLHWKIFFEVANGWQFCLAMHRHQKSYVEWKGTAIRGCP